MATQDPFPPISEEPVSSFSRRGEMDPLTLSFKNPLFEDGYQQSLIPRLKIQSRWAVMIGVLIYLASGVMDPLLMSTHDSLLIWGIRAGVVLVGSWAIWMTKRPSFDRLHPLILTLTSFAAAFFLLLALSIIPPHAEEAYSAGIILITFWIDNSVGLRFYHAVRLNILFALSYLFLMETSFHYPQNVVLSREFFIFSSNIIGGITGYLIERQRRKLFIRELELDEERNHQHLRSLHDRLTGLPNRELLDDRIEQAILRSTREKVDSAGLYIDIDGFKTINDTCGHEVGDRILVETTRRILSVLHPENTLSRIGGDEFFLLIENVTEKEDVTNVAERILDVLKSPFFPPGPGKPFHISASIGICLFPFDHCSPKAIIHAADKAMYHVKNNGKNNFHFASLSPILARN